jgi:hypothetical protein
MVQKFQLMATFYDGPRTKSAILENNCVDEGSSLIIQADEKAVWNFTWRIYHNLMVEHLICNVQVVKSETFRFRFDRGTDRSVWTRVAIRRLQVTQMTLTGGGNCCYA